MFNELDGQTRVLRKLLLSDQHLTALYEKTSMMVIKPKALHIPWLMLLFHQPEQVSYHRLCSGLSYAC